MTKQIFVPKKLPKQPSIPEFDNIDFGEIHEFKDASERFNAVYHHLSRLVMRYLRLYPERILDDAGNIQLGLSSAHELLQLNSVQKDQSGNDWLDEHGFPSLYDISMEIYHFQQLLEKRMEVTLENGHADRLIPETVQTHFNLSSHEIFLLCAVAAAQTDDATMRQFQYASGLNATLFPAWFYAEMLQSRELTPRNILEMLAPDRPLRMFSLIEVGSRNEWGFKVPIFQAPLCVPQRIISYLMGYNMRNHLEYADIIEPTQEKCDLVFPAGFKKSILRVLRNRNARLALWGPKGFGRRSLLREYAASQNLKIIEVDASALTEDENPEHLTYITGEWFREARLLNAILIFRCDNVKSTNVKQVIENVAPQFKRMLDLHIGIICILAKNPTPLISRLFGEYTEFKCSTPAHTEQANLWKLALKNNLSGERLDDAVDYISSSYCMTMGEIKNTVSTCCARFTTSEPTGPELAETLRITRGHELEGLAELKSTPLGLKDIVLSPDLREKINEILNFARYSEFVTNDWDFRRMSPATGLGVLFWGPPGTGKTLTAGVIAHELKRALYVVDISRIVDKYIGETEKRLAKIFDYAQASQAILLFDEADSFFAKRTGVKSSNDRYANLEVNYLLQRLESFNGITILTTNLATSLDEALQRRIQFKLSFPMPDEHERAKLWEVLVPPKARAENIDFELLGEKFEITGGYIKNCAYRACIMAASQNKKVDTDMLWDAGVHELREMGHIVRDE